MKVGKMIKQVKAAKKQREKSMPTETEALRVMFEAYIRLQELGFRNAIYCPKDGSSFEAIEAGSTGIGSCHYSGEWPTGSWWMAEAGDLWPSRPILFRPPPAIQGDKPDE